MNKYILTLKSPNQKLVGVNLIAKNLVKVQEFLEKNYPDYKLSSLSVLEEKETKLEYEKV